MAKLDKLIELKSLEKQNRRNKLEDKLRQQKNYGETEELFDPLTKTLNTNSEAWQAHDETMQALQNKTLEALNLNNEQRRSFLELQAAPSTLKDDRGKKIFVDNDIIDILLLMGKWVNKQINLSD